ncbi:MAG TPA: carboxypeptidase regulatory-like domain-containing protein [Pyrinomonadaceae bacterium]|nr:carboxypeptidase regulatory-like domain-containing protein [Pyrinomonadaceae bacterium]
MRKVFMFVLALCFALVSASAFAQDIQTKGSIGGQVVDSKGAAIPGATVKVTGALGERTVTTNNQGLYSVENLIPGAYTVRVEMTNFKAAEVSNITVYVGKTATTNVTLEVGNISEVVNVTAGAEIDQARTAVSKNLDDQLFKNIPVQRGVTSLFYLAPGTTDSLGGGASNPSISGGSALDNLYVADGVNITDSAFGGIGTFSRVYGSLGTGITNAFVKEVQVKTAGFEAQYGQSEGGIINIITKSGGNEYHGAFTGFAQPKSFEATRKQRDDFSTNKAGKLLHTEGYDFGADAGGPIVKDKLFFFGSFNPTINRDIVLGAQRNAADIAAGAGRDSGLFALLGQHARRTRTLNYAGKVDWNINPNHTVAFSIFGDPSKTNKSSFRSLNIDNATAQSKLDFGTRNIAIRYNGSLTPTWTLSGSFSQNKNHFDESGFDNFNQIVDRTQPARGSFTAIGLGFFEPTKGKTWRTELSTQKTITLPWHLGTHTATIGYQYQRSYYSGTRDRSGPHYTVPSTNADGTLVIPASAAGQPLNAAWSLRRLPLDADVIAAGDPVCTLCPFVGSRRVFLRQDRGEFGNPVFNTASKYNAFYGQDVIRFNKYITANLGLRNEQERILGDGYQSSSGGVAYSFTGQWAPRLGVSVDPRGKGKTKVYYNFGRFFEYIPLDLAERSLSAEKDFTGARFAPAFTGTAPNRVVILNQFGTVTPVVDAAHLLSRAAGGFPNNGVAISAQDATNPILPGTKLGFAQEHVIGFEQQLPRNFVLSVRYIDRQLKRIVEDAAVVSPEGIDFFGQTYFIGNITAKLDAAVNPISHVYPVGTADASKPAGCRVNSALPFNALTNPILFDNSGVTDSNDNVVGAVCWSPLGKNGQPAGDPGADGVPDGFPDPVHKYRAVEIELNKRFSNNWQLLANWRIARVLGNFEGHFRNDNGQTDPAISSLFDFTAGDFNLLGDQFKPGPINTDRRHIINIFGSYQFSKERFGRRLAGLTLGPGFHFETGVPISEFLAHPAYLNAGEIPSGGRGKLGRTASYTKFDMHVNYPWHFTEKMKLNFIADFFNIFNSQKIRLPNQNRQVTVGVDNVDFLKPVSFYAPFNMRLGLRLEW